MHPIERLRALSRAGWAPPDVLAVEAAWALADLADSEPQAMLPACRRLLQRHVDQGPLWWVCAHLLCSGDPVGEAARCTELLESDPSAQHLLDELGDRRVVRRGGVGEVASADVVAVPVLALGPGGMVVDPGVASLLEAARALEVPIWVDAGAGRLLPDRLWEALRRRLERPTSDRPEVTVLRSSWFDDGPPGGVGVVEPLVGVDRVAVPVGCLPLGRLAGAVDCPEPAGLVRW